MLKTLTIELVVKIFAIENNTIERLLKPTTRLVEPKKVLVRVKFNQN